MNNLVQNLGSIVVAALVIALIAYAVSSLFRNRHTCSGCAGNCSCHHAKTEEEALAEYDRLMAQQKPKTKSEGHC